MEGLRRAIRRLRESWRSKGRASRIRMVAVACIPIVVAIVCVWMLASSLGGKDETLELPTDTGLSVISNGKRNHVQSVTLDDTVQKVTATFPKDHRYMHEGHEYDSITFTTSLGQAERLGRILEKGDYKDGYRVVRKGHVNYVEYAFDILFLLVLLGMVAPMLKGFAGSSKTGREDVGGTTFDSVKGEDTAVAEMAEIKDMMVRPEHYRDAGARMPKGVLLYGEPGTGKTLLARALAGETSSSFYAANGAQFVEMFVGLGARRIRKLFRSARDNAPSIIFLDEIDAIGGTRGRDSNSEREQTLNQLLVELDGFEQNGDVLVVAATNRPDFLDKALLRPGRFDRQIEVDMPDAAGREEILKVHADGKKIGDDVDLASAAAQTQGMSGAQLANVMNESALMAVRDGDGTIHQADLSEGIDRVLSGPRKEKRTDYRHGMLQTAYHEGGHAIVALTMKASDPVTKITILPRGRALGYTTIGSDEDTTSYTRSQILAQLAYMMGGRAAEEARFGDPSTGAADDIRNATSLALEYITRYGFGDRLGYWDTENGGHVSEGTERAVEEEISGLLGKALDMARKAISLNRAQLDSLAGLLMERETLGPAEIAPLAKDITQLDCEGQIQENGNGRHGRDDDRQG